MKKGQVLEGTIEKVEFPHSKAAALPLSLISTHRLVKEMHRLNL